MKSASRIIHIPNSKGLRGHIANYQIGSEYIWNGIPVLLTCESKWTKAKQILEKITEKNVIRLPEGVQLQIRKAAKNILLIYLGFSSVKDDSYSHFLRLKNLSIKPAITSNTHQKIRYAYLKCSSGK